MRALAESGSSGGTLRLLVVDDDEYDRLAVGRCLHQAGVSGSIDAVATAAEALERITPAAYDCLLLDYYLPGVDTLSLLGKIRDADRDLPVVIFTGRGDEEVAVEFMKAGAVDYLPKASLTPERLATSLRYAIGMTRAAAARRDAERAVREREAEFRTLANTIPQMAWVADGDGRCSWYNDRWYEFSGLAVEEARDFGWERLHHPDYLARVRKSQREAFRSGVAWEHTHPLRRKDGVYRWFLTRAVPVTDAAGAVVRWFGTNTDITERLEAERAVRASEERLRRALEIETVGVVFFDADGAITGANDAFLRMGGYTRGEVSSGLVRWEALTPPEWMPRTLRAVEEFKATGRTTPYEKAYLRKDGSRRWALFAATRLNEREGVEFVVDVTERKLGEAERERLVARLGFVARASARLSGSLDFDATCATVADLVVPDLAHWCAVEIVDEERRLSSLVTRHADPARAGLVEELFRRPAPPAEAPDPAEESGASELLPDVSGWLAQEPASVSRTHHVLRALRPRSYMRVPLVSRGRTLGRLVLGSAPGGPAYGPDDLTLAEDLAQRAALAIDNARLYIEARDAVRIREAFVARASHELRTPLTSVVGTIALLRRAIAGELKESPEALIRMAERNLHTTLTFINDLLDASKLAAGQETLVLETVDVAEAAGRAVDLVNSQARDKRVVVRAPLPPGLHVTADRLKLEQVISNLLGNAVKFSPAGGEVVLSAERAGGGVLIRVRDQGDGVAPDEIERIFEPFYQSARARAQRHGTGLGLAICRQIVVLHGGRIWAESDGLGRGTTVCVELPQKAAAGEAA